MRERKRKQNRRAQQQPATKPAKARSAKVTDDRETLSALAALQASSGAPSLGVEALQRLQRDYGNAWVTRALSQAGEVRPEVAAARRAKGGGEPLPGALRRALESGLGNDLGGVRIHRGPAASDAAEHLGAQAFTSGSDVYFGKDRYAPDTKAGKDLLVHELTHVLQLAGRGNDRLQSAATAAPMEREAREAARALGRGQAFRVGRRAEASGVLLQKEEAEKEEVPTARKHPHPIRAALKTGTINAGPFSILFRYDITEGAETATLVLSIPDGVGAAFSTPAAGAGVRVSDPGGTKARTVTVTVTAGGEETAHLQATFTQGAFSYLVIFELPQ